MCTSFKRRRRLKGAPSFSPFTRCLFHDVMFCNTWAAVFRSSSVKPNCVTQFTALNARPSNTNGNLTNKTLNSRIKSKEKALNYLNQGLLNNRCNSCNLKQQTAVPLVADFFVDFRLLWNVSHRKNLSKTLNNLLHNFSDLAGDRRFTQSKPVFTFIFPKHYLLLLISDFFFPLCSRSAKLDNFYCCLMISIWVLFSPTETRGVEGGASMGHYAATWDYNFTVAIIRRKLVGQ